ncbi:MAG TPA: DUF1178 family protein [Alphaproteobacteria bacterium]|nr:DUF1178 family protein [Alphaproteobacteria bacterium]
MIVFDLRCDKGHVFEAWFKDSAAFARQKKRRQIGCAVCGSTAVDKAPMAPRIARARKKDAGEAHPKSYANDPAATRATELMKELADLRAHVEKNCDYVGPRFAEEARKIHYSEAKRRNIYGEATDAEASELSDEGIEFSRVPWLSRRDA